LPAEIAQRRDHLVRLRATGRASLADQAALRDAVAHLAPDFAYFNLDTSALGLDFDVTDLDTIDRAGALRMAADQLAADAADQARAPEDRRIAAGALNRLYGYLTEAAQ
jgi:spore coat polysaccharide biosynthesis protein SpsF (cytidylyltransferase family)